jgi:hypothetical protein
MAKLDDWEQLYLADCAARGINLAMLAPVLTRDEQIGMLEARTAQLCKIIDCYADLLSSAGMQTLSGLQRHAQELEQRLLAVHEQTLMLVERLQSLERAVTQRRLPLVLPESCYRKPDAV